MIEPGKDIIASSYELVCSKWRERKIVSRDDLAAALVEYRVYFAYNSNRIENPDITYHDTREVFENGNAVSYSGDVRALFEIQNQKECHEFMLDAWSERRALDVDFLLETHEVLTKGTYDEHRWRQGERPGAFKRHDYVVGAKETGAPAEDTEREARSLLEQLHQATESNILTVGAFFHGVFESIHPFADGNGRVGRTLLNYLFLLFNHPPLIVYDEDKLAYYGALEAWDSEANLDPLKTFLMAETVRTWQRS